MSAMKKLGAALLAAAAVLILLVGCGRVVDGPGMVNTEYDQGY